jgi:hypothetical protein
MACLLNTYDIVNLREGFFFDLRLRPFALLTDFDFLFSERLTGLIAAVLTVPMN